MSPVAFQDPVRDSVSKVDNEVAVGEDLAFQRAWWRFERIVWTFFLLILACDISGAFGRGPLSTAHLANSSMEMKYERVARFGTPAVLQISFNPSVIGVDGKYHLYVSESLIDELGTERVIPSPELTAIGGGGLTYTFAAVPGKATAELELHPSKPGLFHFAVQVPGNAPLEARVLVMP